MNSNIVKLLKITVSILLLWYISTTVGIDNIVRSFSSVNLVWIGYAIVTMTISNLLGAFQWSVILKNLGVELSFKKALGFFYTGLFFNNFLLSFVGGDAVRVYDISKFSGKNSHALSTVFLDRFVGLITISIFALAASFFAVELIDQSIIYIIVTLVIILIPSIVYILYSKSFAKKLEPFGKKIVPKRFHDLMSDTYNSLSYYRNNPGLILKIFLISIFVQSLRITVHYFAAKSLGMEVNILYFFLFIPIITVVLLIPIAPGGVGLREVAAAELFNLVGIKEEAVVFEMLAFLIAIFCSLPGIISFIFRSKDVE